MVAVRPNKGSIGLPSRIIMLVDFDYFFAQCEELRDPTLKDKPVVVGVYSGRTEESGAVSTANYIAREYGVKSGIPLFQAKKKLEDTDAVFLPVDHEHYQEISDRIMVLLKKYADIFEQVGIDEAFLDVTKSVEGSFEVAKNLAHTMKANIRAKNGITCSIGLGPNKLVAKIAADSQKPDGLTIIKPGNVPRFLDPLSVNRLMGVGKVTTKRLEAVGIRTVGDLARYDVQKLVGLFGKNLGVYFHNVANGIDEEPVREASERVSLSKISTLRDNTMALAPILEKVYQLAEEIHEEVIARGLRFKQIGIIAVLTNLKTKSRSQTLERATNNLLVFKEVVKNLVQVFLNESELEIRRIGVKVSHFVKEEKKQKRLTSFM